jgi:cysteine desulfurase
VLAQAPDAARIPVQRSGLVDLAALDAMLPEGAFVSVMLANNETGVIQPLEAIALLVRARGGLLHTDAAQALGKLDMTGCPADLISLCAHKMGGPVGAGALLVRTDHAPAPLLRGGGQEFGWRAGSQNIPAIAGFAAALDQPAWQADAARLRDLLEAHIAHHLPEALILGPDAPRLCNTSCLWMPGVAAATQVMRFDLAGFAVSAGSACSSGKVKSSHVLSAMGLASAVAGETIRVSIGWETSESDILAFAQAWARIHAQLSRSRAA